MTRCLFIRILRNGIVDGVKFSLFFSPHNQTFRETQHACNIAPLYIEYSPRNVGFHFRSFLSAKKGKKKKCKTVDLMSFLADGSGTPNVPVKPLSSWVDDMEEEHGNANSYILYLLLCFHISLAYMIQLK